MTSTIQKTLPKRQQPGSDRSFRTAAVIAGLGLLVMSVLAGFGNFIVIEALVTPQDAAKTADDILAAEGTFRLGVLSMYLVVLLDVIVARALMRVFDPVSTSFSRLAGWFRLAYSAVFMVAISQLAGIPDLLAGRDSSAFTAEQVEAQALLKVDAFNDIWDASLILVAVHLVIIGYLAFQSGYVPRLLGVLLVIAGLGYAVDSFAVVLTASPPIISTVTFIGEFLLCLWLLISGRHLTIGTDHHAI